MRDIVVELEAGNRPGPRPEPRTERSNRRNEPARDLWSAWTGNAIPTGRTLEIGLDPNRRLVHQILDSE